MTDYSWEKYGCPRILNEKVREAARCIGDVFEINHVGGSIHAILGQWNIDNEHVQRAMEKKLEETSVSELYGQKLPEAERKCLEILVKLTVPERASALAFHEEFFTEERYFLMALSLEEIEEVKERRK